jgi:hypothetical protein
MFLYETETSEHVFLKIASIIWGINKPVALPCLSFPQTKINVTFFFLLSVKSWLAPELFELQNF